MKTIVITIVVLYVAYYIIMFAVDLIKKKSILSEDVFDVQVEEETKDVKKKSSI